MDLLADFITDDRIGYCEQFAAAMAAMGRSLRDPVARGRRLPGRYDEPDGRILYTSDDRHAWPEMYFSGVGWVRFEPTPSARAGATPAWTRQSLDTASPSAAPEPGAAESPAPRPDRLPADAQQGDSSDGSGPVVAVRRARRPGCCSGSCPAWYGGPSGGVASRPTTRSTSPKGPGPSCAPPPWTSVSTGRTNAHRASRRAAWWARSVPRTRRSRRSKGCWCRWSEVATARRTGRRAIWSPSTRTSRSHTVETVESWRRMMLGSVDRERGWRGRLWPVSLVRGLRGPRWRRDGQ